MIAIAQSPLSILLLPAGKKIIKAKFKLIKLISNDYSLIRNIFVRAYLDL